MPIGRVKCCKSSQLGCEIEMGVTRMNVQTSFSLVVFSRKRDVFDITNQMSPVGTSIVRDAPPLLLLRLKHLYTA